MPLRRRSITETRGHYLRRDDTRFEFRACVDFGPGGIQYHDAVTVAEAAELLIATREAQEKAVRDAGGKDRYPILDEWVEVREVSDWKAWQEDQLDMLARIVSEVEVPERSIGPGLRQRDALEGKQ